MLLKKFSSIVVLLFNKYWILPLVLLQNTELLNVLNYTVLVLFKKYSILHISVITEYWIVLIKNTKRYFVKL